MAPALSSLAKSDVPSRQSTLGSIIISRNSPGNYEFFKTQPEQQTHTDAERTEPERTTNARRLAAFCLRGSKFPFSSVDFAAWSKRLEQLLPFVSTVRIARADI